MAFDNKVINGTEILLSVDSKVVACATSHSIELTNAIREISCKNSGDFTSAAYGRMSWTITTDALLNLDDNTGSYVTYSDLMTLMFTKTEVAISSAYDQDELGVDTHTLTGNCIITSINQTAGDNENASYSVNLQGIDALVQTVVEAV